MHPTPGSALRLLALAALTATLTYSPPPTAAMAQSGASSSAPSAGTTTAPTYTDAATGLNFPQDLAGQTRGIAQDFESKMPGLGSSIGYSSPSGAKSNIYIYNMKKRGIPADPNNEVIREELERSKGEVFALQDKKLYSDVRELDTGIATMGKNGAPKMRYIKLSFNTKDGVPVISYLLMTGYKGNFFKIRYSYPASLGDDADKDALRYFAAVGNLLQEAGAGGMSLEKRDKDGG
ncbi:hypothetical protein DB346_00180 [Verrucomicrobia bacterium LW23]|nr:hypothetical protein DB346_00180 [Verrucomicrobia bacterium LW23]